MIASAPGKLILSGEYAVIDGAPALVIAVSRRAVARIATIAASNSAPSPFLAAVATELEQRSLVDAAARAHTIAVDSTALYDHATKLGLGSSAAVTVAATALALDTSVRDDVFDIAFAAHLVAQGSGSGADIAAAVYGGTIEYVRNRSIIERPWPTGVRLVTFFTGASADTATLVAQIAATPRAAELAAIGDASAAVCAATSAADFIAALHADALAFDRLAEATRAALVPPSILAIRARLVALGGTAKTTGAGGGDVGIAVAPEGTDVGEIHRAIEEAGCRVLDLTVDGRGVDIRADEA